MPVLFLIVSFLFVVWGAGRLYKKVWSKGLSVTIAFQDEPVVEGESGQLSEIIRNEKKYPVPVLNVKFQTSKYLRFSQKDSANVSDLTYKNDIFALMPYQQIKRTISFECRKRGFYHIDKAEMISSFMFFGQFFYESAKTASSIYVYPAILDIPELNCFLSQVTYSSKSKNRLYEDAFSFAGIREYQPYDPQKSINWKASAKTGGLMVNIREYTSGQPVVILVNLEKTITWHMDSLLEESIRLAATAADAFIREGIPVTVWTTYDKNELPAPACSEKAMDDINKRMALIDLEKEGSAYDKWLSEVIFQNYKDEYTYLLISHDEKKEMLLATEGLAACVNELWQIRPVLYGNTLEGHSAKIHVYERTVSYHEQEHRKKL